MSPYGLEVWTPGFPAMGEGDPHTSSECISDACDPLPPKGHPDFPYPLSLPNPSPGAAGEGNWAGGNHGWGRGASFGCVMSTHPPPHELLLIISLYPPHQKRSAPNQGEILGGWGSPSHPLKYIPHLQRQGAQEAEESGETKTRRGSDFRKHFCGAFHSAVWREAGSASLLGKADPDPATVAQFDCSLRPQGL